MLTEVLERGPQGRCQRGGQRGRCKPGVWGPGASALCPPVPWCVAGIARSAPANDVTNLLPPSHFLHVLNFCPPVMYKGGLCHSLCLVLSGGAYEVDSELLGKFGLQHVTDCVWQPAPAPMLRRLAHTLPSRLLASAGCRVTAGAQ